MKTGKLLFAFAALSLISCGVRTQQPAEVSSPKAMLDLEAYNCFSVSIKYDIEGEQREGTLLFVSHSDREMPLRFTNVYLLSKSDRNFQLVGDTAALTNVYDVSVSPDYRYLAVSVVGEGHPWIEIYDLQMLIHFSEVKLLAELNPYPGSIRVVGWESAKLVVESDADLLLKNEEGQIAFGDLFESSRKFYFDLSSKKYSKKP